MGMRWNVGKDAARVAALRRRIERWRWARVKRTRMPEQLWAAATELAREHGAYRIAQALGVGYQTLKDRLDEAADSRLATGGVPAFVEFDGSTLLGNAVHNVVELSDRSGHRLVIRLVGGVDVTALLAAFLERGS